MAVYDLEEQEQIDEIKTWWKMYGNLVTTVVVTIAVTVVGWQAWNAWQRHQTTQASAVYNRVVLAAGQRDVKLVREAAGELIDKFSRTSYAGMGALLSAKVQFDAGDLKGAKLQLAWAAENTRDGELRDLARLRFASLLLDEKSYDEALKQLATESAAPFAARYAELKGDIFLAQGKQTEAKAAYQVALTKFEETKKDAADNQRRGSYREILQIKLESAGTKP